MASSSMDEERRKAPQAMKSIAPQLGPENSYTKLASCLNHLCDPTHQRLVPNLHTL